MNRRATGLAGLLLASLVLVPGSAGATTPAPEEVPAPAGRSEVSADVSGPGATAYSYDSGSVRHRGSFTLTRAGSGVSVSQTDKIGAHSLTSTGRTRGTAVAETTKTARNQVKVSFSVKRTARWKVQVRVSKSGTTCVPGAVVIGQPGHRPFVDGAVTCGGDQVAAYTLNRSVTLRAGARYTYTAGHGRTDVNGGGLTWSIRLFEDD